MIDWDREMSEIYQLITKMILKRMAKGWINQENALLAVDKLQECQSAEWSEIERKFKELGELI